MEHDKTARASLAVSSIALVLSLVAIVQTYIRDYYDYAPSVVLNPGLLPLTSLRTERPMALDVEVRNVSHVNLSYLFRIESNVIRIQSEGGQPQLGAWDYLSQPIELGKSGSGSDFNRHHFQLIAPNSIDMPALAYNSDPKYYLSFEVVNAQTGKTLLFSKCYYYFSAASREFILDQPTVDTSGESRVRQAQCR